MVSLNEALVYLLYSTNCLREAKRRKLPEWAASYQKRVASLNKLIIKIRCRVPTPKE